MLSAIDGFLRYLKIERNSSELTLKSYSEDFNSLLDYFHDRVGSVPSPGEIHTGMLRGYVSYLHECNYAKTTMARRLASLAQFLPLLPAANNSSARIRRRRCARRVPAASCRTF